MEPGTREERVADIAAALGVGDALPRRPAQLSGGQRQRVAMGRAIVREPQLFLMDEPLSNLDSGLRAELRAEISALVRQLGVTTVYVTHDQAEALTMADRVAILRRGVLQDVGTPTEVYRRPATLYVAAFLGSPRMNLLEASVYVHLDRYIALHLGEQVLQVPWSDMRARQVAHFHGERIVVGVRAEALSPTASGQVGSTLQGSVRYLEHHGHESLAFLDIGAYGVAVDDAGGTATPATTAAGVRVSRIAGLFRRSPRTDRLSDEDSEDVGAISAGGLPSRTGAARATARSAVGRAAVPGARAGVLEPLGRHHRTRAELVVRLPPYPSVRVGDQLSVSVLIEGLHFFDGNGIRVDVGWR
jgi:multiple sugar transport system ATP-binding protein